MAMMISPASLYWSISFVEARRLLGVDLRGLTRELSSLTGPEHMVALNKVVAEEDLHDKTPSPQDETSAAKSVMNPIFEIVRITPLAFFVLEKGKKPFEYGFGLIREILVGVEAFTLGGVGIK